MNFSSTLACLEAQTQLTSNVGLDKQIPEGTTVTLTCSNPASSDPNIALRILRRRAGGGGMDGFEDLAHVAARVTRVSEDRPDIAATFTVHRKDDGAVFICGDAETLGFRSQNPTASLTMRVQCKHINIPIVP